MKYKTIPKTGDSISVLAFGGMRFPKDESETERLLLSAIDQGINYFDTAYIYPGSEATIGRIFTKHNCRDRVKIATKLPYYMTRKLSDVKRFWNIQLERLQTDYIDYYLIHSLTELAQWQKLCAFGIEGWIDERKRDGSLRHIGFSYHGGTAEFKKLVDAYDWDFCMIQYNYLDEHTQAGLEGLEYAASKNLPVMIMEPLQGGRLAARLPKEAEALFHEADPARSSAEWGLRWVYNHPGVCTLLSGMTTQEILEENVRIASDAAPGAMSEQELKTVERVRDIIQKNTLVPCTGCKYCLPCPHGVDIPMCFSLYNETARAKNTRRVRFNYIAYVGSRNAGNCTQCGKCERHCPQSIAIRKELKNAEKSLERFPYKPVKFVVKRILKQK